MLGRAEAHDASLENGRERALKTLALERLDRRALHAARAPDVHALLHGGEREHRERRRSERRAPLCSSLDDTLAAARTHTQVELIAGYL